MCKQYAVAVLIVVSLPLSAIAAGNPSGAQNDKIHQSVFKHSPLINKPDQISAVPLTVYECTKLGGAVGKLKTGASGLACSRKDEHGRGHAVCLIANPLGKFN